MKLDSIQQAAQAQFGRQSLNYGRSHILADVSDVVAALNRIAAANSHVTFERELIAFHALALDFN